MGELIDIKALAEKAAAGLVSHRAFQGVSYISLPMVYPGGDSVTVEIRYSPKGIRVSDNGFAYRDAEDIGVARGFTRVAASIASNHGCEVIRRSICTTCSPQELDRAIMDVGMASHSVAEALSSRAEVEAELTIADEIHTKLDRLIPEHVRYNARILGSSQTEWEVTASASVGGKQVIFHAVTNHPIAIYRTSTAFHDIRAGQGNPICVSVVHRKDVMGPHLGILAQAGHVISASDPDKAFMSAMS
ncbi:hypothetical protein [Frigidibacter sp. MR17.24]|uniref:hypothetical protein n=1 Tax=Frigidibacter sp. MR17.24 TaxID=3127345 RepID=UPI003012B656